MFRESTGFVSLTWNLSGKRKLQKTAVIMLAMFPVYSLTMLSRNLRMAATTRPPQEPMNMAKQRSASTMVGIWTKLSARSAGP